MTLANSAQKMQMNATTAAVIATGEWRKLCQTSLPKKRRSVPGAGIAGAIGAGSAAGMATVLTSTRFMAGLSRGRQWHAALGQRGHQCRAERQDVVVEVVACAVQEAAALAALSDAQVG